MAVRRQKQQMDALAVESGSEGQVRTPAGQAAIFSRQSRIRQILRYGGLLVLLLVALIFVDFLRFANNVADLEPPENIKADAIVVLTGASQRIAKAVALLDTGAGQRLLISGVNPVTTSRQISHLVDAPGDLFDCCVDIGYQALDTIGNAHETAAWIRKMGYRRVLLVTHNYHMPRSLLELRRVDPDTVYIPYPVVASDLKRRVWLIEPTVLRAMMLEYVKYSLAWLREHAGASGSQGLRSAPHGGPHD